MQISIRVTNKDVLKIKADVLVLKHAQNIYGVDELVLNKLGKFHSDIYLSLPVQGDFLLVSTYGALNVEKCLFMGVEPLRRFRYQSIRNFAYNALEHLAKNQPDTETICFTIHGAGYGLDIVEAFESEIAGIVDALSNGYHPKKLQEIIIAEINPDLSKHLKRILADLLPNGTVMINENNLSNTQEKSTRLRDAGITSEDKPLIFVAMPFDKDMYDTYYYGIRNPVHSAGYLCERIDEAYFFGEIIEQIKSRIQQSDIVIADLSKANANVYLEVGYAWGCNKPTLLLVNNPNELKFDVKGQRCIIYESIKELEEKLQKELERLR